MDKEYNLYKGIQKPLVFKYFKGRYIYWGVGAILFGLILTMIVSAIFNLIYGTMTCAIVVGGGLTYTSLMQKKGLNKKNTPMGVFIYPNFYKRKSKNATKKRV